MSGAEAVVGVIQAVVRVLNSQPACNTNDVFSPETCVARFPPNSELETSLTIR